MADEAVTNDPPVTADPPVTDPPPAEVPPTDPPADLPEGEKPEEKPAETPVEYTDFTLPEGIEADQPLLDGFKQTARELGLPQDGAQKLVDLYAGVITQQAEAAEKQKAEWEAEIREDPKHEELLGSAAKALKFADEETQKLLKDTVLGSHPGLVRFLAAVGRATGEDRILEAGNGGGNTLSLAERIYGKK